MDKQEGMIHESAYVDSPASIGHGTRIWHFCHIMRDVTIGESCSLGQNCFVASGVTIGNRVKIQNHVSVYSGTIIEDDVFLGPSCVLTNVSNPRSQIDRHAHYEETVIQRGATVGANATVVCGVTIGRYAFVAAGSVVTKSVPDYTLVLGNPARPCGWISRHGHRLTECDSQGVYVCPESGLRYQQESDGTLRCLDLEEDQPLPKELAVGRAKYREVKKRSNARRSL